MAQSSRNPSRRASGTRLLAVLLWMLLPARGFAAPAVDDEVKAAFILRFAEFIEWPAGGDAAGAPLRICVLGEDPIEAILARLTQGYAIRGRAVEVRRTEPVASALACHAVFVPAAQSAQLPGLRAHVEGMPVLVISNSPGLASRGAAINLFREGSRLRFEINPATLEKAGLKASSRLLRLAVIRNSP